MPLWDDWMRLPRQPSRIWGHLGGGIHMVLVTPTGVGVLVMAVLAGLVVLAEAFADCPELEQLQSAYCEAVAGDKRALQILSSSIRGYEGLGRVRARDWRVMPFFRSAAHDGTGIQQ